MENWKGLNHGKRVFTQVTKSKKKKNHFKRFFTEGFCHLLKKHKTKHTKNPFAMEFLPCIADISAWALEN